MEDKSKVPTIADANQVYISCLSYLASEAERDKNHVIADILKSAASDIYEWVQDGTEDSQKELDTFTDSISTAFLFILQYKSMSKDKKHHMMNLISSLEAKKLN